ncbi:hypothetical protein HWV62_17250 [Athelia sp. TMB]|nr:hypothetical protein HWV62_17250 [Athelia sp. TMB]
MCGIVVSAYFSGDAVLPDEAVTENYTDLLAGLYEATAARGPDAQNVFKVHVQSESLPRDSHALNGTNGLCLDLYASELRLRGDLPVVQPHQVGSNVLCWNGEILPHENDGIKLIEAIEALSDVRRLPELFGTIEGPGSNVSCIMEEVPTNHFYCIDLHRLANSQDSLLASVNRELPRDTLEIPVGLDEAPAAFHKAIDGLIYQLDRSVKLQVQNVPHQLSVNGQARVAVLFSGGIDCTILAFFASQNLPIEEPIDLLNVAFDNPRKVQAQSPSATKKKKKKPPIVQAQAPSFNVPDRLTGLQEVEELRRLCPGRTWNFVEVNVPYEESQIARVTIERAMAPSNTVMDLSLAIALWFASRGVGTVRSSPDGPAEAYTSTARVLLNGLGSDELLGGYGRHRTAYTSGGWQALIDELQLELERIPSRNLGRDDRVISSHGKETRHPFLSLSVVTFLAGLPVHLKVDPRLELGVGDKILLRLAARKVGLLEASGRKKKAMQFGSHSARMEVDGKEKEKRGDLLLQVGAAVT